MAQSTLEAHFIEQSKKLEQLIIATTLIQNKKNIISELTAAQTEVFSMRSNLDSARADLEIMRNQNQAIKTLSSQLDELREVINHMESNLPPQLLHDYANMQLTESKRICNKLKEETPNCRSVGSEFSDDVFEEDKENMVKNCKKILFNEPAEVYPRVKLLEKWEFDGLPKYMIGRQTLDAINQFVNTINEILKAKYTLLALGKNGARKKGEFDLYMAYLKQETIDSKGKDKVYFFTAEDYLRYTKTNLDKTKLKFLIVLRHCKRLREIRVSKVIQYAVVTTS